MEGGVIMWSGEWMGRVLVLERKDLGVFGVGSARLTVLRRMESLEVEDKVKYGMFN